MKIIDKEIPIEEIKVIAKATFGNLVKVVVDAKLEIMAVGGDLHADEEAFLLERGSKQSDLWGINLYPEAAAEGWIEFDSMVNLRPSTGNMSRGVDSEQVRQKITEIVDKLIKR